MVVSLPSDSIQAKVMVMLTWRFRRHIFIWKLCACNKVCFPISSLHPGQLRDPELLSSERIDYNRIDFLLLMSPSQSYTKKPFHNLANWALVWGGLCSLSSYNSQLIPITATEEKKAHSVDGTAVTINVSVQQDGSTRTGPMLGLRLSVHKQTGEHGEIKDAIRVMSDHTAGKMSEIKNDI